MAATFREPLPSDVEAIGRNMRAIDALECAEGSGLFPVEAVRLGIEESTFCRVAVVEGEPVCVFGVAPEALLGATGIPWLLGVEGFERHSRDILRYSRPAVRHMLSMYPHLKNIVHSDNQHAIHWLRWCGFTIGEEVPAGRNGAMFRLFELRAA